MDRWLTDIIFVFSVGLVHHLEQLDFDLGLVEKRFFVFDDFDGHVALLFVVVGFDNLAERALADERVNFVAIEKAFAVSYNVVVIIIVVTIVVYFALFLIVLLARVFARRLLLRSSFLLGIIYLSFKLENVKSRNRWNYRRMCLLPR